ncbi:MAG: DMT family transporter [Streptosporangiaceae bacterium]
MYTPLAVTAALGGALLFGISSVADQHSTKRVRTRRPLSPRILLDLIRQPLWLTAVGATVAGFTLQVVALDLGSLALVQPLLVCDLIFAVLIVRSAGWQASTQRPGTRRWDPVIFAGVAAATAGVGGFLAIGQPSSGHMNVSLGVLLPLVGGLVGTVGGCLAVAARNRRLRPLALALACGVTYGIAAFTVKLVTSEADGGLARVFGHWPIYVLAVVGPAGFILNQDAFQQGRLLAPVQAVITTADPVISVGLGVLWLGVRLRSSPADIFGEITSLLLMVAGIAITAHHAPQVTGRATAMRTGRDVGSELATCRELRSKRHDW